MFGIIEFLFPVMFLAVFGLVFGTIVGTLIKNGKRERINNSSPRITAEATVVTKRTHYSTHRHHHGHAHYSSSSSYYATFEVESGDRMELMIPVTEFGLLVEGDRGNLTFQGTRYLSFERI
jgi:hypothetical protein